MGLDEFVNEFIPGRNTDGSIGRRTEYTADDGSKVYRVDLWVPITAGECGRTLAQQRK